MANRALVLSVQRERDAQLAAIDYLTYSIAVIHGIPKESITQKMETLDSMRASLSSVIYQNAYDESFQRTSLEKKKLEADREKRILEQVKKMGEV